jgi:hypothetical protein
MNTTENEDTNAAAPEVRGFSPWQRLKSKKISYLTLPLLCMATVTEFVILATGWKYQQVVCLPQGMGVTFFGIGPIGATILAVELLKLPLAIWTASRRGWQKGFMLMIGLPMICLLTFQLVKDMAVYEMGVAMKPAMENLEKAIEQDNKAADLKAQLASIEDKKADRQRKLDELAANKAKAKADLEESLKRNDDSRTDAISLTDYQKKELSEVESRQATIIAQFNADTEQLNKQIADLRARREVEMGHATQWNAEEARIDNAYKAKMIDYENKKGAYEKAKADYMAANVIKRQFMHEPVDPGVPPERESNKLLKPTVIAEIDEQLKSKEAELLAVNNKRRDRVAQVDADARQLREEYDHRSTAKREEADKKREALIAAEAATAADLAAQQKQIDADLAASVQKVDGIRSELDEANAKAESYYEAREAAIRNTQVHRIATTVEIVRGLLKGERPASIKATAKERGDILTDQISMVRICVYPVLAFIVAFLPTLMVEIGFSTIFEPEKKQKPYRVGWFGRALHQLYIRAGKQKMLRFERMAKEASGEIAARELALSSAKDAAATALMEKEKELTSVQEALAGATTQHAAQLKAKEDEFVSKLAGMVDSLNRATLEKDALRDMQKSEVERQIQMRQNAWSDRITQLRQELDDQRNAAETERTTLMQEHHRKMMEVSEEAKAAVTAARRQAADAELAAIEANARLQHDLKEAIHTRDEAEAQLQQQNEAFTRKLAQLKEDSARDLEKALRQEKHRFERQVLEASKTQRDAQDEFEHRLKQREQELNLAFDARLIEEQSRIEQNARRREEELERRLEARAMEVDARWKQDVQQREEAAQVRLKQREQQLAAQAEARLAEVQKQNALALRDREEEWNRLAEQRLRTAETRMAQEMQQKVEAVQVVAKQREQEIEAQLNAQAASRQMAAQAVWEAETEKKLRAALEPLKAQLAAVEKERDEAKSSHHESTRHVQKLEKKLTEASSFLSAWRNGDRIAAAA